jgi:hypothetical protein
MQNLQQIPGETDVDLPIPFNDEPVQDKRDNQNEIPVPPGKFPSAPIGEPPSNNQTPINENPREPQRIMSFYTAAQRKIF